MSVQESSLGPLLSACPLCGSTRERFYVLELQQSPKVDLFRCSECLGMSASRMPTEEFLEELYEPSVYSSSLVSSDRLSRRCARNIVNELQIKNKNKIRILDYGGSDGNLARQIIARVRKLNNAVEVEATIVDLYPRDDSKDLRYQSIENFFSSSDKYDVVVASAVLEHLIDVKKVSKKLLESCISGGLFYARTPYESPLAQLWPGYKLRWPRHLHDLGPEYWEHFLETYSHRGTLVKSRPSIVESDLLKMPVRASLSYFLKLPSVLESKYFKAFFHYKGRMWRLVGGWEVFIRVMDDN